MPEKMEAGWAPSSRTPEPAANLDSCPRPERVVSVLVVSPLEEDHRMLRNIFSHSRWQLDCVSGWEDAKAHLACRRTPVIICERDVPGGTWREMLATLSEGDDPPLLIVTSRLADERLWAEVLNLGGYDVLMKPFDQAEVFRVVSLAWLNWKENRERKRRLQVGIPRVAAAGI